ncbi:isochorismate synthase [Paracoccus shanxieyensis]|uniref:isochorismate synthase n=1 Tax=Paracoccus shanxieyensis TaxID=2675752 RepID=A0A6L6IZC7_9RHOB|nr:isochorismate synthase [Paracoccus shanxieyensis]MTH65875.1 isochorismate synthase [Paracoccus shanxieyensis]MTH89216.1 isochorismate synthase [Paracoccus shanxieyensis]
MNIRMSEAIETLAKPADHPVLFAFDGPQGQITGRGAPIPLPRGTSRTLPDRVARAMATMGDKAILGGALPFDREDEDCLWLCPASEDAGHAASGDPQALPLRDWDLTAQPAAADYAAAVDHALRIMADEAGKPQALEKIVLARSLLIRAGATIPVQALMDRLGADPAVTAFRVTLPARGKDARRVLCGATPELLLEKRGRAIASHPLAGSARRMADEGQDRANATALEQSEKDRREHAFVVEYIMDVLGPHCRSLSAPAGTTLTHTRSMWHLGTRIEGELKDPDTPSVVLAGLLHPTPAVCGAPMRRAYDLIGALEPLPRDFYAGAVGWCDAKGDGAWQVAIRCAQISGAEARLYAGAGIVPGSDPMAEAAETGAKFGAFLTALGLPLDAGLAGVTKVTE